MVPTAPEPGSGALAPALVAALQARMGTDGFVPFDRFMDVALYGAGVGYYARARSPFGPQGDYYTAPRVHPLFARTVAARVLEVHRALGRPAPFRVVDLGSGDGGLLAGILRSLAGRRSPEGLEALVVDRSAARRASSLEAVRSAVGGSEVPVNAAASVAEVGPGAGVLVANELLDAQPARQLRWDGSAWREVGFRLDGDRLEPAEGPLTSPVPLPPLPVLGGEDLGTTLEFSPAAEALVREVADHLEQGLLVLLDFGAEEPELLRAYPRGTTSAVRAHRQLASPATAPGEADLSTFVNFTRVRHAARLAGLEVIADRSQAEALGAWGFPTELELAVQECRSAEEEVRVRLAAKNLLFGFGNFRALELAPPASAGRLRALSAASPAGPP